MLAFTRQDVLDRSNIVLDTVDCMTTLAAYMAENDITDAKLAERLHVTSEAVRLWRLGKRSPRAAHLRLIREKTAGAVTPADFFGHDDVVLPLALSAARDA